MKKVLLPRPGQVYLDTKTWNLATIYEVDPGAIRAVATQTSRGRVSPRARAFWSTTWKSGVPAHYVLQYNPPPRKKERQDADQDDHED